MNPRKPARRTSRKSRPALTKVVRTTVGDLIAASVDAMGGAQEALELFTRRSPMPRILRQRLVFD
jgi:hypothetical protein